MIKTFFIFLFMKEKPFHICDFAPDTSKYPYICTRTISPDFFYPRPVSFILFNDITMKLRLEFSRCNALIYAEICKIFFSYQVKKSKIPICPELMKKKHLKLL
jgi:hypothetical protein